MEFAVGLVEDKRASAGAWEASSEKGGVGRMPVGPAAETLGIHALFRKETAPWCCGGAHRKKSNYVLVSYHMQNTVYGRKERKPHAGGNN